MYGFGFWIEADIDKVEKGTLGLGVLGKELPK